MPLSVERLGSPIFHYPIHLRWSALGVRTSGQASQTALTATENIYRVTPESVSQAIEEFLGGARNAVVRQRGAVLFDLSQSKYSVSGEHNKCLLHLWSPERNVVRRLLDFEAKNDVLRFSVQRLGQSRPEKLEICRQWERRSPAAKRVARLAYGRTLQRMLERRFTGWTIADLRTSADLWRSFGPIYTRGLLRQGQSAFAVLGVNSEEAQSLIDAALTFGILWLDLCRQTQSGKAVVEGLKLFVPAGCSGLVRERMGHLNRQAAKWQLYEFNEREDSPREIDISDCGNVSTHLVHATNDAAARERFGEAINHVRSVMPEVEVAVLSPAEIAFRHHGLEFARARLAHGLELFRGVPEIVFGIGANERVLEDRNNVAFLQLVRSIGEVRHPEGPHDHLLWRLHPERWLESLVMQDVSKVDERLDASCTYSQVPAFSSSDRAMIDVLTVTHTGRLAVLELKADEDIHLPVQGLDYWSRVSWHHARGEFQQFGYFAGRELSSEKPLLFLVAPALHVHPATDTLLRYLSPEIEWNFVAIDERWREKLGGVFRKRPARQGIAKSQDRIA